MFDGTILPQAHNIPRISKKASQETQIPVWSRCGVQNCKIENKTVIFTSKSYVHSNTIQRLCNKEVDKSVAEQGFDNHEFSVWTPAVSHEKSVKLGLASAHEINADAKADAEGEAENFATHQNREHRHQRRF